MSSTSPLGKLLRDRRSAADKMSLRTLGRLVGVSYVFLGECERGMRILPEKHWKGICRYLPVTDPELRRAKQLSMPLKIDVSRHPLAVQEFMLQLQSYLDNHAVSAGLAADMTELLTTR